MSDSLPAPSGGQALDQVQSRADGRRMTIPPTPTRFRALKVGGRRKAFALEPEFWAILDEAAARAGVRIGDYIGQLVSGAVGGNASSILRRSAARWLLLDRERTRREDPTLLAKRVTEAIALPALVIDDRKRIVAHNPAFLALGTSGSGPMPRRVGAVHLHLAAPVGTIAARLSEGKEYALRVDYVLDFGAQRKSGRLNIALLNREEECRHFLCVFDGVSLGCR